MGLPSKSQDTLSVRLNHVTIETDKKSIREELDKAAKKLKDTFNLEKSMKSKDSKNDSNLIPTETSQKLVTDTRALALATVDLIRSSTTLLANPESRRAAEDVGIKLSTTSAALQGVLSDCGTLNPVVQKCERVIVTTNSIRRIALSRSYCSIYLDPPESLALFRE